MKWRPIPRQDHIGNFTFRPVIQSDCRPLGSLFSQLAPGLHELQKSRASSPATYP